MKNANFRRPIRRKLSLILAVAALIAAFAAAWRLSPLMSSESLLATWNWLMFDRQGYSGSAFRNMLWAVGLILGLILATWRVKVSNWQAQTAEWSHRESRYEKGADMLGSDKMPIRVFGVAALSRLAADYPNEYHNTCVDALCTFILLADSAGESGKSRSKTLKCRPDFQAAAQEIGIRREALGKYLREIEGEFRVDLRNAVLAAAELEGANFSSAWLDHANLTNAILDGANFSATSLEYADLSGAQLENADFSNSRLAEANLSGADLNGANLSGAELVGANLSEVSLEGAELSNATLFSVNLSGALMRNVLTLSQTELDCAFIINGQNPPILDGSVCAITGKPLVWQGERR